MGGDAGGTLGERESGTGKLEEAVAAYREALKEWTRERVPLQWAAMQMNLGAALSSLGERERGTRHLEEAVAAFRAALEEETRDRVPRDWAMSFGGQGVAMMRLAKRKKNSAMAKAALLQIQTAYETMQSVGDAPLADYYKVRARRSTCAS
jgi:tetratricopeptide (TPR) repeat protein